MFVRDLTGLKKFMATLKLYSFHTADKKANLIYIIAAGSMSGTDVKIDESRWDICVIKILCQINHPLKIEYHLKT